MFRRTVPLIVFAAGLTACGVSDSPLMPLTEEALLAKGSGPTDPTATFTFDAGLSVQHDGNPEYANGVCGVTAKIFATTAASNSGDATMQTNNPRAKDRSCQVRTLTIDYGDGSAPQTSTVFINVHEIANTNFQIAIGQTVTRALNINEARCGGLAWRSTLADGTDTDGADPVNVTRVDESTWLVASQPYPDNEAYCRGTGQKHNIDVRFTIVSSYPLPVSVP